ncbi:MAG TPA: metalloregulator ArsR/SmtB family transcription factor [Burkholderiales bacterium]|nr:metalloregulator ArsR/SmtB family transcription factor [Burkholderiales bacterium]
MLSDHLSATFSALADPTRRAILARLATGETSVTELAAPFEMTTPAVTKHLKVLERAGLITRSRQAQWRPCQLNAAPLHQAADFIEQYRQFWEQSFDRLDAYLKTMQTPPQKSQIPKQISPKQKERKNGRKKR